MKIIPFAVAVAILALTASPSLAHTTSAIAVVHPWIAPPPMGALTAAGYAVIQNRGAAPDALVAASSPDAEKLELHTMSTAGGVMRMRPAQGAVAIAPGQALSATPGGGYHFMFIRPRHPLKLGERVPVTLTFAKAGPVHTVFMVKAPAAP